VNKSFDLNTAYASNETLGGQIQVTDPAQGQVFASRVDTDGRKSVHDGQPLKFTEPDHLYLLGVLTVWRRLDVRKCSDGRTSVIGGAK
jgi:hypothetical protein